MGKYDDMTIPALEERLRMGRKFADNVLTNVSEDSPIRKQIDKDLAELALHIKTRKRELREEGLRIYVEWYNATAKLVEDKTGDISETMTFDKAEKLFRELHMHPATFLSLIPVGEDED